MTGDDAAEDGEGSIAPEQAFAVLGDETRLSILRALAERPEEAVGFNELRKAVGAKDSSGFNYHLGKLVGHFVRKAAEGYELTTAGSQVYGAILSGAYTDSIDLDPIELTDVDDVCPDCGGDLVAIYEDERMSVTCVDCDRTVASTAFPPAAVEGRPPETLPEVFGGYLTAMVTLTRHELCPLCSGQVTGRLKRRSVPAMAVEKELPLAIFECERCSNTSHASPGYVLLTHPAVVGFYYERGIDVRDVPPWRMRMLTEEATTVVGEDPLEVAVDVQYDGDRMVITIDENLEVVKIEGPQPLE